MRRHVSRLLTWALVFGSAVFFISPASAAACTGTTGSSGSYTLMKFTAAQSGCTWSIPAGVSSVDLLIVGGGGGAGFGGLGGGGGAGAVLTSINAFNVIPGDVITMTVGNGGTAGFQGDATSSWYNGGSGIASSVTIGGSQYIATGGGGGGGNGGSGAIGYGAAGGSGGGGTIGNSGGLTNGNTYAAFNNYGNNGVAGSGSAGGGGGGSSAAGSGSTGGAGRTLWGISFAGGGGGWPSGSGATSYGAGSATSGQVTADHGVAGTNGTGSGGGGGSAGGSGLIVFRYLVDAVAPTLSSATIPSSGTSLVLTFSESISATTAPTTAFTVTTNGAIDTVTSLSVSGVQITLNLQIQVTSALTVLLSYADPTAGDDLNAVQDLGYNDAASFTNQSVVNNSTTKTPSVLTLALSGDGRTAIFRNASTITLTSNAAGKVRFTIAGKAIPGCQSILTSPISSSFQAVCNWKPSMRGQITVTAAITQSSNLFTVPAPVTVAAYVNTRGGNR